MPFRMLKSINKQLWLGLIILFSTIGTPVWAQFTAPKYVNEFLSIGVGARAQGLAGTYTMLADDATAGYWNPAGLVHTPHKYDLSLMHAQYFAGIANFDHAGVALKVDSSSSLAVSFIRFGVDNIADTRFLIVGDVVDYNRIRRFSAADHAFIVSYARKSKSIPNLSFGGNAKIIYRNAGTFANAWGFGLDAAVMYRPGNWLLGAMVRDATGTFNAWSFNTAEVADVFTRTGNVIPEGSVEVTLPRLLIGAGYKIGEWKKLSATPLAELQLTTDGQRNVVANVGNIAIDPRVAMEAAYDNMVFARFGAGNWQQIKEFDGSRRWSWQPNFGLGFRIKRVQIDYALTDLGNQSEALYSHVFSVRAMLGQ